MMESIKTLLNGLRTAIMGELGKLRGVADTALTMASTQPDWAESDAAAAGFIKNRTHWSEWGTLLDVTLGEGDRQAAGFGKRIDDFGITAGAVYTLEIDGVDMEVTADINQSMAYTQITGTANGNRVTVWQTNVAADQACRVRVLGDVVHRLDAKFLPANSEAYLSSVDPVGFGSSSMNRAENSTIGGYSHAEGLDCTASGYISHAEGQGCTASGSCSHAEGGMGCTASGSHSHAEGYSCTASGSHSHAEGEHCKASGGYSHAEGTFCTASGSCSHAEGGSTTAQRRAQHVQGEYNILDTEGSETTRGKYAHIVGNGTSYKAHSNAHTLDWAGVAWFQGRPQFGGTAQDDGSQTVMANGDTEIVLTSSTAGSTKKFKITVDDTGALTATEVE